MSANLPKTTAHLSDTALLCSEYLLSLEDSLPFNSERFGTRNDLVAISPTSTLAAKINRGELPTVIYGVLRQGNRKLIDAPTAQADKDNIVWLGFNGRRGLYLRALLLDGEFTAFCPESFASRKQTTGRYGVKVSEVQATLESPFASWMRSFFDKKDGSQINANDHWVSENVWSRAILRSAALVFETAAEFYQLDPELQSIVGTFVGDGIPPQEAVLAAQSI